MGTKASQRRYWTVVATKTASARDAISNLIAQSFVHYQPEYREPPVRGVRRTSPLFPGYLFVQVTQENWRPVGGTKGIKHVFMVGPHPARVHNAEIEHLRSLENHQGYIEPEFAAPPTFAVGESVEAKRGIFQDKFGTYVGLADTRGGHRVRVLFDMLGRSAEYEISAFDLGAVAVA